MATTNINQNWGQLRVIDKRRVPDSPNSPIGNASFAATQSTATVDAALGDAYWSQARLNATCMTDKLHALRVLNEAAGIS
jgi:hypothetical protein